MSTIEQLRAAIAERSPEKVDALFADGVRVFSPMKFSPFTNRDEIRALFQVLITSVFDEFDYVGGLDGTCATAGNEELDAHVLVFRAVVGGSKVHGIDLVHLNEAGQIDEFTIMIRPHSALVAVSDRVTEALFGSPAEAN